MSGYRSYRRSSALPSHFTSSSSSLSSYTPSRSSSYSNLHSLNSSPYTSSYDSSRRGSLSSYKYPSLSSYNLHSFQHDPLLYRSRSASRTSSLNKSESDLSANSASSKPSANGSNENDEKDYKKLYEESLQEIERLKKEFSLKEAEFNREKRQQQRKISEYEEELKMLEILRSDNQRLKDENGALIRVISKLSKWKIQLT